MVPWSCFDTVIVFLSGLGNGPSSILVSLLVVELVFLFMGDLNRNLEIEKTSA